MAPNRSFSVAPFLCISLLSPSALPDFDLRCSIAAMGPPDKSQDDRTPPVPPPSPELGSCWPQTLQTSDGPSAAIVGQPMSNLAAEEECSGDEHGFGGEGEGGELSDGATEDDVTSTSSAASSNDNDSSVETAITENTSSLNLNGASTL
jgi:hypothetical protein